MSTSRLGRATWIALLLSVGACRDPADGTAGRPTEVTGIVVAWVGDSGQREAVTVGLTAVLTSATGHAPATPLVAGLFREAQRYIGATFKTVADAGQAVGRSPRLREHLSLEMRDPRYRVSAVRINWVVRGTRIRVSDGLCSMAGQKVASAAALGAGGVYLCAPLEPVSFAPAAGAGRPAAAKPAVTKRVATRSGTVTRPPPSQPGGTR